MEIDRETNEDNSRRIQVRFLTKLKAPYKVPTTAIAIPSDLSRLGLSSIVNKLLQAGAGSATVATASKDQTLRLWKFDAEDSSDHPARIRAFKILRGHNASIHSVAAKTSGDLVCSGSWDCTINLWRTNDSDTDGDVVTIKKRKVKNKAEKSQSEGEAVSTLVGHTQCVSCVVWPQHETIYSASWDHSVRRWDVETGKDLSDIWPLAIIDTHKDKVLCADWWKGDSVVSGGVDAQLQISSDICIQ